MPVRTKKRKKSNDFWQIIFPLLVLAFTLVLAIFWGNISWVANGDVWRQMLADAFPQYFPRPYVMAPKPVIISGNPEVDNKPQIRPSQNATSSNSVQNKPRRDMITIPGINITAPIITSQTNDTNVLHGLLDSGVVLYPGSVPFGDTGQTVLLGHSAPAGWPKIKYDWVFSRINELKRGDMIVITYNHETRYFKVVSAPRVVSPKYGVPEPTVEGNSLMLVSCWPPGQDLSRIVVEATILDK